MLFLEDGVATGCSWPSVVCEHLATRYHWTTFSPHETALSGCFMYPTKGTLRLAWSQIYYSGFGRYVILPPASDVSRGVDGIGRLHDDTRFREVLMSLTPALPMRPFQFGTYKLIYRRYAGLFFTFGMDTNDNELLALETVHLFVELLESYFSNVCELDIVFNFNKVGRGRRRLPSAGPVGSLEFLPRNVPDWQGLRIDVEHVASLTSGAYVYCGPGGTSSRRVECTSDIP